jgi:hypothetical protein
MWSCLGKIKNLKLCGKLRMWSCLGKIKNLELWEILKCRAVCEKLKI